MKFLLPDMPPPDASEHGRRPALFDHLVEAGALPHSHLPPSILGVPDRLHQAEPPLPLRNIPFHRFLSHYPGSLLFKGKCSHVAASSCQYPCLSVFFCLGGRPDKQPPWTSSNLSFPKWWANDKRKLQLSQKEVTL